MTSDIREIRQIFILLIIYRKYWKQLVGLLFALVIMSKVPSVLVPTTELFQEKIGIPIQQISYVVKNNYESISKEDKKYLNKILERDEVDLNYNPYTVDTIKWHKDFDRMYLYASLVKWYNAAMVRLNCRSDSYRRHHLYNMLEISIKRLISSFLLIKFYNYLIFIHFFYKYMI